MVISKIGLIGLTLASFILVPMMPSVDADSSEISSWTDNVYSNLDGFRQDYDFKQFSPDLNALVNGVVDTYENALSGVITFYESVNVFFSNPAVLIFGEEDFSDDPLDLTFIPDGRMTQILFASTFLSNQQVVDQILSESEKTYIASKPLVNSWPWVQGYFFHIRNTIWPISDNSIYYYCTLS
jgi:hypothetical protein